MSIDLTALPEDVETLQRMITDLVRERDSARAEAEAEIARLTRILMCLDPAIDYLSPIPARIGDGVGYSAKHLVALPRSLAG